jgi:hypothetical protein
MFAIFIANESFLIGLKKSYSIEIKLWHKVYLPAAKSIIRNKSAFRSNPLNLYLAGLNFVSSIILSDKIIKLLEKTIRIRKKINQ